MEKLKRWRKVVVRYSSGLRLAIIVLSCRLMEDTSYRHAGRSGERQCRQGEWEWESRAHALNAVWMEVLSRRRKGTAHDDACMLVDRTLWKAKSVKIRTNVISIVIMVIALESVFFASRDRCDRSVFKVLSGKKASFGISFVWTWFWWKQLKVPPPLTKVDKTCSGRT